MASSSGWNELASVFVDILIRINVKTFGDFKIEQIFCPAKILWIF